MRCAGAGDGDGGGAVNERLGDAPIQTDLREIMNGIARGLDDVLNGDIRPKKNGFILLVFPFENHDSRCNYISNANRADVVVLLKEQLARFEGQPEVTGRA
jgi:hypothetical protein